MLTIALTHSPQHYCAFLIIHAQWQAVPVNMFLYHVKMSSLLTSEGFRLSSTTTPSESMTLYVGMAGCVDGCSKERVVVNLLFTAPGKLTLPND